MADWSLAGLSGPEKSGSRNGTRYPAFDRVVTDQDTAQNTCLNCPDTQKGALSLIRRVVL